MENFEKATRLKLRFDTPAGALALEDLWDLPLTSRINRANLDDVARGLHRQLKGGDDVSFVLKEHKSDETIQLKFDLVKHVIDVRLEENKKAAEAQANRERRARILEILADKEDETLKTKSVDELRQLAQSLAA